MSSNLLSLAGWYFLPNLVTGWVQSAYYAVWIRAGEPKPQPGSRAFAVHRRRIHILVILAYLLYTIYEADYEIRQAGDFYRDLGVRHDIDDRGLQSRFRRITITHHPDKISDAAARPAAEALYVHLKLCRDVLIDPAKRFAYDRFGPDILRWRGCTTIADYVKAGLRNTLMYYFGTGAVMMLLGVVGYLKQAAFWRYLALATLFTLELHTQTHPFPILTRLSTSLTPTLPLPSFVSSTSPYLPYQALQLCRKLVLTFFIALSQIGPLLSSSPQGPSSPQQDAKGTTIDPAQLDRLVGTLNATDQEVGRLLALELTPFASPPPPPPPPPPPLPPPATASTDTETVAGNSASGNTGMRDLKHAMRRWLVDNTVRSNAEVRSAVGRVIERRRGGVPAGALGNR